MRDARIIVAFVVGVVLLLAIGSCQPAQPEVLERPVTVVVPEVVTATPGAGGPVPTPGAGGAPLGQVPFEAQWAASGHADAQSEAFVHWNEEDPQEIPIECAKCHSTFGYQDYLGADGSAAQLVNNPSPVGSVINCVACHNGPAAALDSVIFPSGASLSGLGPSARCETCHQGTASMVQVTEAISQVNVSDLDTVSPGLQFVNIHYYASAATMHGSQALGGYQYEGKAYPSLYPHVESFDSCVECHDPHTTQVRIDACGDCHAGVTELADLHDVRMEGSLYDFDGDGNTDEGIYFELQGLQDMLYQAIQSYAREVAQAPIIYDASAYPYFFNDTNANGEADQDELQVPNRYASWTPRLLKAGYNLQVSVKDPGSFAHNALYIMTLLRDSIADLNPQLSTPIDLAQLEIPPEGHFSSASEAFRHWDEDGVVPGECAKCHTAGGVAQFLAEGTTISAPPSSRLECASCHDDLAEFTRYEIENVTFPSGAEVSLDNDNNVCLECHQGNESSVGVERVTANLPLDQVSTSLPFVNPHYFAAGATLFGDEVKGPYQYQGKTYVGRFEHVDNYSTCSDCHDAHNLQVNLSACGGCHQGVTTIEDVRAIRLGSQDYVPGGGPGIGGDVGALQERLFAAIQSYASSVAGTGIVYSQDTHPYFFADTNGNGRPDADELNRNNRYQSWTPRLLRAAYNYQWSVKDSGSFVHNGRYMVQILYDSIENLGQEVTVDLSGVRRP